MGLSQSKVTRMETGRSGAMVADVEAWAAATAADPADVPVLVQHAERARVEAVALRRGGAHESEVTPEHDLAEIEQSAALMLTYSPMMIPDLLQTAEYARRQFQARQAGDHAEIAAMVATRVARQAVLFDDAKRFEIILGEPALRWRAGPPAVQLAQLDRIRTLATLSNVLIGIVPLSGRVPVVSHGFAIYDELIDGAAVGVVETLERVLRVRERELDRYRDAFEQLRTGALLGDPALALIADVLAELGASVHQT
jgi:hypothetical protein